MSSKVKADPDSSCPEYEDLSPDSRVECRDNLDREIEALEKKRKAFAEVDSADPLTRTLLVLGVRKSCMPVLSDFVNAFDELRVRRGRYEGAGVPVFSGYEVFHETNWKFQEGAWKQVDECFLRTRGVKEARFLLNLPHLDVMVNKPSGILGCSVRFVPATQDDETRKTFNVIGGLIERLREVTTELHKIGIDRNHGVGLPTLSDRYIDKAVFDQYMVDWKRQRDSGDPLNCWSWAILQSKVPVKLAELSNRMIELYKEECYSLMKLREFQSNGYTFTF